ncbi:MAG: nucleoside-diphosphate kinase [Bacteroidota bacterium]
MKGTKTLTIIKPKACENKYTGDIIKRIENEGFVIKKMVKLQLTCSEAAFFYKEHTQKPFFQELCTYIASGPIVVMQLEKANAVADFRKLLGDSPNPAEATKGSLRAEYGIDINYNAVHGSDSDLASAREAAFFFGESCCKTSANCNSDSACS